MPKESASRLGVGHARLLYSLTATIQQVPYERPDGRTQTVVDEGVAQAVGISRIDNADIETARNILNDHLVAVQNQVLPPS